jgi:hypothetical protein
MEIDLLTYYAVLISVGMVIAAYVMYRERHPRKPRGQ